MKRLALSLMLLSFPALADIPPADSVGCREKTAGAACKRDDQSEGTCVTATCSKNDYSGGIPPKTVSYDCLKCGTAVVAPTPAPAPAPAASPAPAEKKNSCAAVPGEALAGLAVGLLALRRARRP